MFKRLSKMMLKSDNKVIAAIGRWLQRYKSFLKGVFAGILLMFLMNQAWDTVTIWWYSRGLEQEMENYLDPPPFPPEVSVDYEWMIRTLDDQEMAMTDFEGKVVFLNFWATWCPPCVAEMPSIQRLYNTLKDDEVAFVCISDEEGDTVRKFVEEKGFTFPVYTIDGELPEEFMRRGIPTTFILSKEGKIAFKHIGGARWDDHTSIDFIRNLL